MAKYAEYVVPEGVRNVFGDAFWGTKIKKIALSASVKDLAWSKPQHGRRYSKANAVAGRKVEVAPDNERFSVVNEMLLSKDGKTLYRYFGDDATELRLPASVETIEKNAIFSFTIEVLAAPGVKNVVSDAVKAARLKTDVFSEKLETFSAKGIKTNEGPNMVVKIPTDAKIFRSDDASAGLRRFKIENVEPTKTNDAADSDGTK